MSMGIGPTSDYNVVGTQCSPTKPPGGVWNTGAKGDMNPIMADGHVCTPHYLKMGTCSIFTLVIAKVKSELNLQTLINSH